MPARRSDSPRPDLRRIAESLDRDWEDARNPGGPVAIVVLGLGFLAAFSLLALIFGMGATSALLLGWAGSLACVVVAILYGAWREHVADQAPGPRSNDEHVTVWEADLSEDTARSARFADWDTDRIEDAVIIDAVPVRKRRA